MHRDHPGAVRSERRTQAVRASAEEAARELEEVHVREGEEEEAGKRIAMLLYPYVYDNIYCCVLEVFLVLNKILYNRQIPMSSRACMMQSISSVHGLVVQKG